jgi:hypothetical protein
MADHSKGFSSAKVVMIHGWAILMNEEVGVEPLQSAGRGENLIPLSSHCLKDSDG